MSNPIVHAFFLGKAVAEVLQERAEHLVTDVLSEIGKFDAEQRVYFREFAEQVQERAQFAENQAAQGQSSPSNSTVGVATSTPDQSVDLQATLDDLRSEMARLRAELKKHRESV